MPYVDGYTPEPAPEREPALIGLMHADGGALMIAKRYGRKFYKDVPPNGVVTFAEAAALLHRRDPETGELRPVTRLAVYQWAEAGKIKSIQARRRSNTRPVACVRLSELRRFAAARGFTFRRVESAAPGE